VSRSSEQLREEHFSTGVYSKLVPKDLEVSCCQSRGNRKGASKKGNIGDKVGEYIQVWGIYL
jgi:hypothetical protein